MKLYELTGVKKFRDKNMFQLLRDIKGEKFEPLGSGVAAQVFLHNGQVYKFWVVDSLYEKFIEMVEKNQDDPHLPKLKSKIKTLTTFFDHPKDFPKKIKYVKMEQLKDIKYVDTLPGTSIKVVKVLQLINDYSDTNNNDIIETYIGKQDFASDEDLANALEHITELQATWKKIMSIPGVKSSDTDLHYGNAMFRGDTIVITDPLIKDDDLHSNISIRDALNDLSVFKAASDDLSKMET